MKKNLPFVMLIFQIAVFVALIIPGCKMSAGSETSLEGEAYLILEYFWQEGDVHEPSVSAELAPYIEGGSIGVETPVEPFEIIEENGFVYYRYEGVQDEGIYNLSMLVEENGAPLWSNDRVLSITEGTESRVSVDIFSGEVQIEIEMETVSPLAVGLSIDPEGPLTNGTDMLITAAVSGGSPPYSFRWYLNGNPVLGKTGFSLSVGSSLPPDRYRVTCIAFDGVSLGSAGIVFDVLSLNPSYLLSGTWFSIDSSDNFIFLPDGPVIELDPHDGSVYNLEVDFTPDDTLYNEQWNLQHLDMPASLGFGNRRPQRCGGYS
jgi:hypothetical protein